VYILFVRSAINSLSTFEHLMAVTELMVTPVGVMYLPITAHGRCDWPGRYGHGRPSRQVTHDVDAGN